MHPIFILFFSLASYISPYKAVHDSFEVKSNGHTGYILPIEATEAKYDPGNVYYRPSASEVDLAEKMMASYLDIFCRLNKGWRELDLSASDSTRYRALFTSYFKGYYRQYTAYVPKKGGHKFISICLVSPDFQDRVSDKPGYLEKRWAEIDDGGPILFHADIDLVTGDVFLRDNGSG